MEQLKHILFIDIETVPCVPEFNSLSEALQLEWKKKAKYLKSSSGDLAEPDQLFFDIPSPKGDIDGSMVGTVYWKDKDLARIAKYCLGDVLTTARVFLRLKGYHGINPEPNIVND